ncbi:MAG TPA: leucyl aminopeptidase [Dehalococcoidales bacterium]|nr:leucyl aminopeptidase [Dehalococcoidales bacterium]
MEVKVIQQDILDLSGDAMVMPLFEDAAVIETVFNDVDKALQGAISQLKQKGEIKGKHGELTVIFTPGKVSYTKVVITGLGKKSEINLEKIRVALAGTAKAMRQKSTQTINFACPVGLDGISPEDLGQAIVEGVCLGTYNFRRHLTKAPENSEIKEFNLVIEPDKSVLGIEKGVQAGKIISEAVILARDLANEPANHMNPSELAKAAAEVAGKFGIPIQIFEKEEIQKLKMGGLLGVSQGSIQLPRFIIMNYKGREADTIDIALLGKGITFDSGGISLKPSDGMGEMKGDMAGGADVIAAMGAIAQLKPKLNVLAMVPATENMPGGSALKPGDIITIMNGKTVEIISTDAEGRLILADAICYAQQMGAKRIVDVATLTGSCHVALGDVCSGTFGNDQEFINQIIEAGQETGECLWQLPMNEEYRNLNRSDVADIKNTGGRYGGAIAAAWFLREFVENVPWIHLDIAGTSTLDKERGYLMKGNTGVPVRTLIRLVLKLAKNVS